MRCGSRVLLEEPLRVGAALLLKNQDRLVRGSVELPLNSAAPAHQLGLVTGMSRGVSQPQPLSSAE